MPDQPPIIWSRVVAELEARLPDWQNDKLLNQGQVDSLRWVMTGLPTRGLVIADEVGTGKTRIACAIIAAVVNCGGRVAVVVPPGLMHQWQKEAKPFLTNRQACEVTTLEAAITDRENSEPNGDRTRRQGKCAVIKPSWLLISQRFGVPRIRKGRNPKEWRVAIPSYVRALLSAKGERKDERTKAGRVLGDPDKALLSVAEDIYGEIVRLGERQRWRGELDTLPPYQPSAESDNQSLTEALQGNEGREILHHLLGLWLGDFDVVIIDEAHKSRSHSSIASQGQGQYKKRLQYLLDDILRSLPDQRRICLTATPMEMDLEEWAELIQRARNVSNDDRIRVQIDDVIMKFKEAIGQARISPDERGVLENLIKYAGAFSKSLSPFVTRRRRIDDELVRDFRKLHPDRQDSPHPHRHRCEVLADCGTDSKWNQALFISESLRQSRLGLYRQGDDSRRGHQFAQQVAAGRIVDLPEDLKEAGDGAGNDSPGDEVMQRKRQRATYWEKQFNQCLAPSAGSGVEHHDHPRIIATARAIEEWTVQGEKVLVFGVFTKPMELLRDVLNIRHDLDVVQSGRPLPRMWDDTHRTLVEQQLGTASREIGARWSTLPIEWSTLKEMARKSHMQYVALRAKVRRSPGIRQAINARIDLAKELRAPLTHYLRTFIMDDLCARRELADDTFSDEVEKLTKRFFEEHVRVLLGNDQAPHDHDIAEDQEQQDDQRRGDLLEAIEQESSQVSHHTRLLDGRTKREARIILQSAFNHAANPQVLIAQSQVGREGLNLHQRCRVVVQFHLEWNPGVVEQQIGRVDRTGSLWEQRASEWMNDPRDVPAPFIEVRSVILDGTYDVFQWQRVQERKADFEASLFGSVLPGEVWEKIPAEWREKLKRAAIDFSPPTASLGFGHEKDFKHL